MSEGVHEEEKSWSIERILGGRDGGKEGKGVYQ